MDDDHTEDEYYGHIRGALDYDDPELTPNPLIDHVASYREWTRCKRALLRWIAEKDAEYDRQARVDEHEVQ